jgi:hypothetical protein
MDVSKFLAKVIGLYLIIVSAAMLTNMQEVLVYIAGIMDNPSLLFVTGLFTLILGLLMVVSHNVWQWNWRVLITIIAWIVLLKGSCIALCPQWIDSVTVEFLQSSNVAYIAAGFDLALGILLCYFGFRRQG